MLILPLSRRKVLGVPPMRGIKSTKQSGKKEGGNSAFSLQNQNKVSPATCLNTCLPAEASAQAGKAEHHRKIPFSLEEKEIGHVQNEKSKEYFYVV